MGLFRRLHKKKTVKTEPQTDTTKTYDKTNASSDSVEKNHEDTVSNSERTPKPENFLKSFEASLSDFSPSSSSHCKRLEEARALKSASKELN